MGQWVLSLLVCGETEGQSGKGTVEENHQPHRKRQTSVQCPAAPLNIPNISQLNYAIQL